MRRAFVFLMLLVLPAGAGEVTGKVTFEVNTSVPQAARRNVDSGYSSAELAEARRDGNGGTGYNQEVENVVVFLEGSGLPTTPPTRPATMDQKGKVFRPHVLPVVSKTKVEFPNNDRVFHHVYSNLPSFEFPRYRSGGDVKVKTFSLRQGEVPTVVELFCGIHSQMNAFIVVLPNACFSRTLDGKYSIKNVPPGTYTLKAWHPRAEPRLITVGKVEVGADKKVVDVVWK